MEIENNIAKSMAQLAAAADRQHQAELKDRITPRAKILNEAMKITHHDRNANYGNPEDNFQHIANLWNAYLRVSRPNMPAITPADVATMNMLIKVARLGNNPAHHDSAVDIAGYAACLGDIQERMRSGSITNVVGAASGVGGAVIGRTDTAMQAHARNHESSNY